MLNLECLEVSEVRKKGKLIVRVIDIARECDLAVDNVEAIVGGAVRAFRTPEQLLKGEGEGEDESDCLLLSKHLVNTKHFGLPIHTTTREHKQQTDLPGNQVFLLASDSECRHKV